LFRKLDTAKLIAGLGLALAGAGCLRVARPPAPAPAAPPVSHPHAAAKVEPSGGVPAESAHELFISALTCFGAPIYTDAIGVELREASATIDRACAPLRSVAFGVGAALEDDDAYLDAVRRVVDQRADDLAPAERYELLALFDKGIHAVREARSPWGLGPWGELVELAETLSSPLLRDEAKALATLLEADRRLRNEERKPTAARELVDLEEQLIERSSRLPPSDLRSALDGCVQRLRTMI
jgi:hypothetical protein